MIARRFACFLCSLLLSVSAAHAQNDQPASDDGLVMPVIPEEDRKLILQGLWWDENPGVLPELSDMAALEKLETDGAAVADDGHLVDPFPENDKVINEQFLPEYIKQASNGLIDPQRLLGEVEKEDVIKLIGLLELQYKIKVYVSMFAPGQEVPPAVNAPALARQIFGQNERSLLLHVHYGEVMSMQIACDAEQMARVGDQGRRALLARVKESASLYTDPQDSLMEALASMVLFAQSGMQGTLKAEPEQPATQAAKVPTVNIEFEEKVAEKKAGLADHVKKFFADFEHYVVHAVIVLAVLAVLTAFFLWWRNVRPVRLLPSESDKRLGAPYGAGVSRVVHYGDREDADPDSISRQQMRDHLRDIS